VRTATRQLLHSLAFDAATSEHLSIRRHRDVKPQNLFVFSPQGQVRVMHACFATLLLLIWTLLLRCTLTMLLLIVVLLLLLLIVVVLLLLLLFVVVLLLLLLLLTVVLLHADQARRP
jgi:hypothetical protein